MTSTPRFPTSNVRSKRGRCSIRGSPVHRIFRAGLLPTGRGKLKLLGKPCTSRSRWVLICGTDQTGKVIAQNDRLNPLIILRGEQPWQQQRYQLKEQRQAPGTAQPWTFSRSPSVF